MRNTFSSNRYLSALGHRVKLPRFICDGGRTDEMANAVEALLAAIYLDSNKNAGLLKQILKNMGLDIHAKMMRQVSLAKRFKSF